MLKPTLLFITIVALLSTMNARAGFFGEPREKIRPSSRVEKAIDHLLCLKGFISRQAIEAEGLDYLNSLLKHPELQEWFHKEASEGGGLHDALEYGSRRQREQEFRKYWEKSSPEWNASQKKVVRDYANRSLHAYDRRKARLMMTDAGPELERRPKQFNRRRKEPMDENGIKSGEFMAETPDLARPIRVVTDPAACPKAPKTEAEAEALRSRYLDLMTHSVPSTLGDYEMYLRKFPKSAIAEHVHGSGEYVLTTPDGELDNLMSGGNRGRKREKIIFTYRDGTPMVGPYHGGALPWDAIKTVVKTEDGNFVQIGYAGAMEQPYKMLGAPEGAERTPMVRDGWNFSRDRHWFVITKNERGQEVWVDMGSLQGTRPRYDGKATGIGLDAAWQSDTHTHGYGGRPLLKRDGTMKVVDGSYWFVYEDVIQKEVTHTEGPLKGKTERIPFLTRQVAQRMRNPGEICKPGDVLKLTDGREVTVTEPTEFVGPHMPARPGDPVRPDPWPASLRGGIEGRGWASLTEGVNIVPEEFVSEGKTIHMVPIAEKQVGGKRMFLGVGSSGDYVAGGGKGADYGSNLYFRYEDETEIGSWRPVLSENGLDFENFTRQFEKEYGLSWVGRPEIITHQTKRQSAYNYHWGKEMELWMYVHGIDLDTLPPDFPVSGWPKPEQFELAHRNAYVLPINIVEKPDPLRPGKYQPWIQVEDPARALKPKIP